MTDYTAEILRSGFPGLRNFDGRALELQLDGYLRRIVDRDFPALDHAVRKPDRLRGWMAAYAAATATATPFEKIREAAVGRGPPPPRSTIGPYRDILERLFILDDVPAWLPSRNRIARLGAPPKHHLADPALAARLLGVSAPTLLRGGSTGPALARDGTLLGAPARRPTGAATASPWYPRRCLAREMRRPARPSACPARRTGGSLGMRTPRRRLRPRSDHAFGCAAARSLRSWRS